MENMVSTVTKSALLTVKMVLFVIKEMVAVLMDNVMPGYQGSYCNQGEYKDKFNLIITSVLKLSIALFKNYLSLSYLIRKNFCVYDTAREKSCITWKGTKLIR